MATTWYFRDTNAAAGPTGKASTDTDTWPSVPSDKNTPKDMIPYPGSGEHNDGSNQYPSTTTSARYSLGRIFVSPPLAAQTLTGGQAGYRVACGIQESSTSMNLYNRWFAYIWRSGSGNVKTLFGPTSCATEHTSKAEDVSPSTTGAAGNFSILEDDRIVVELWFDVRNSKNQTYTATHYYDGTDNTMADGSAPTASQCGGYFICPQTLNLKQTAYTQTTSLDSYLQAIYTKTPNLDGLLQKLGQEKTPSLDAALNKPGQIQTASIDSYLLQGLLKTLSLDAILYAATVLTKTLSIDSLLSKIGVTKEASIDGLLKKLDLTKTASIDGFLQAIYTKTPSIDGYLFKAFEKTPLIDGYLFQVMTKTVSIDAALLKLGMTKETSIDSILQKLGMTKTTSFDGLLEKLSQTKSASIDGYVNKEFSGTASLDAYLQALLNRTASLDAILYVLEEGVKEVLLDALIQKLSQIKTTSIDGYASKGFFKTATIDGIISQLGLNRSTSLDAILYVLAETLRTISLDACLSKTAISRQTAIDAILKGLGELTKGINLDAFLLRLGSSSTASLDAVLIPYVPSTDGAVAIPGDRTIVAGNRMNSISASERNLEAVR